MPLVLMAAVLGPCSWMRVPAEAMMRVGLHRSRYRDMQRPGQLPIAGERQPIHTA